jgi:hypothetical protein
MVELLEGSCTPVTAVPSDYNEVAHLGQWQTSSEGYADDN